MELAPDLTLVGALVLGAFTLTAIITAWVDNRFPLRGFAFMILTGVLAWQTWEMHNRELVFEDVPESILRIAKAALDQVR